MHLDDENEYKEQSPTNFLSGTLKKFTGQFDDVALPVTTKVLSW